MADKKPATKKLTVKQKSTVETKNYNPQQIDFAMRFYLPTSPTFSNAYASAKAANYSESQAKNITVRDYNWLESIYAEICGKPTDKKNLVAKAKRVLDKSLDSADERISQDTAKFIAKTDIEFSDKSELTVKLPTPILGGATNKAIESEN